MTLLTNSPVHERFQILALDGGGIKGVFSAAVLAAIEQDLGSRIADHFDLIAGTSTGGIIALGLGLGLTPRQVLEFYLHEGRTIFANPLGVRALRQSVAPKFSADPLASALKRHFGAQRFGDSRTRLVIPAYNLGEDDVYIFRTAHHERLKRDYKVPAWKVALATSAAPTYFPAVRDVDHVRLVDGGVWANTPTMVAIVEAFGTLGVPLPALRVLSLGTTDEVHGRRRGLDSGGFWQWRTAAIDVIMRGQSIAATNQARFLIGEKHLLRVNPPVPAGSLHLDGVTCADDLIGKAAHVSRREMPVIEQMLAGYTAPPFTPYFQ